MRIIVFWWLYLIFTSDPASPSGARECAREGQHWRTHGDTYEEAIANGKEALESLIVSYEADGEPLPQPTVTTAT